MFLVLGGSVAVFTLEGNSVLRHQFVPNIFLINIQIIKLRFLSLKFLDKFEVKLFAKYSILSPKTVAEKSPIRQRI